MHSDVGLFPLVIPLGHFYVEVVVSEGNIRGETHVGKMSGYHARNWLETANHEGQITWFRMRRKSE